MVIAIDFDGTIVEHEFPDIGAAVAGAFMWMKAFQEAGAKLILWTMRHGETLDEAVEFCKANGVEFWGVNTNPGQKRWTLSPKAYAVIYIDDAALGCPLLENPKMGARPFVNWAQVGPRVMERLQAAEQDRLRRRAA